MQHIYVAAPFFNPDQLFVVEFIERSIADAGLNFYSPRSDGALKDMTREERAAMAPRLFSLNCRNVATARLVFAVVDGYDAGTIWEMGYAYGLNVPCVTYSHAGRGENVMLRQSSHAHVVGWAQAQRFFRRYAKISNDAFPLYRDREPATT